MAVIKIPYLPRGAFIEFHDSKKRWKVCEAHRRCLPKGTAVIMADGSWKNIEDIRKGDTVLSHNGNGFVPDKVKNSWSTGTKQTLRVDCQGLGRLYTSSDHVFLASSDHTGENTFWRPIKALKSSYVQVMDKGLGGSVRNGDLAELIGYLSTDGTVPEHMQSPKFTNTSKELCERVEYLAKSLFDIDAKWYEKGNGYDVLLIGRRGSALNPIKALYGENAGVKEARRLPACVWTFDDESIWRLLSAAFDGNGTFYMQKKGQSIEGRYIKAKPECRLSCGMSGALAKDFYWLLRKVGVHAKPPEREKGESSNNYIIRIWANEHVAKLTENLKTLTKEGARLACFEEAKHTLKRQRTPIGTIARRPHSITEAPDSEMYDIETEKHHVFVAEGFVVHNSGKSVAAINHLVRSALQTKGNYAYIGPTYVQTKRIAWQYVKDYTMSIPKTQYNEAELKVTFLNGSIIYLLGSEKPDSLRGLGLDGVVFDEYQLQPPSIFGEVITPALTDRNGYAIFIGTTLGQNQMWRLREEKKDDPDWFTMRLKASESGILSAETLEAARQVMTETQYAQEFELDPYAPIEGAIWKEEMSWLRENSRMTEIQYDSLVDVDTYWDLGIFDYLVVLFMQKVGQERRIIDCYYTHSTSLETVALELKRRPYFYGTHYLPHDADARELQTGLSARDFLTRRLSGNIQVVPRVKRKEDSVQAVRLHHKKLWIHKELSALIDALNTYSFEYDEKKNVFKNIPKHSNSSHFADALQQWALTESIMSLNQDRSGYHATTLSMETYSADDIKY